MIPLDKETFECYMERLLEQLEKLFRAASIKEKKHANYLNGEKLYDNQDICLLLNVSKRTLQRYRDNGLKYYTILHKTYYKEKDLHEFIRRYFDNSEEVDNKKEDSYEISPEVGEQEDTN
ncbi:helix-turn-helix domain-containing protein [Bacteroides fragilis]|uniref:helix-turn-helix domain-containing protein n=1 Tax=Bacteroides fragilis TaxID=817 RepID=UPI00202E14A9|nr:helix-turn-helix domain-containing protein [Bacteroides fragilis]MCM0347418.1 helix-turn-helix domain-containing protein [Bacteroides fragilis]